MPTGLKHARIAAENLRLAVTCYFGEGTVDGNDRSVGRRDGDTLGAAVEDRGRLPQAGFHAFAFGNVEHEADQSAHGAIGLSEGCLVEHHIAYLAIGIAYRAFVDLRASLGEQLPIGRKILVGQLGWCDVVRCLADQIAGLDPDEIGECAIATEIADLGILVKNRTGNGFDQLLQEMQLLREFRRTFGYTLLQLDVALAQGFLGKKAARNILMRPDPDLFAGLLDHPAPGIDANALPIGSPVADFAGKEVTRLGCVIDTAASFLPFLVAVEKQS